jgi:hypothetical protein
MNFLSINFFQKMNLISVLCTFQVNIALCLKDVNGQELHKVCLHYLFKYEF